jgi:hypothetical protein
LRQFLTILVISFSAWRFFNQTENVLIKEKRNIIAQAVSNVFFKIICLNDLVTDKRIHVVGRIVASLYLHLLFYLLAIYLAKIPNAIKKFKQYFIFEISICLLPLLIPFTCKRIYESFFNYTGNHNQRILYLSIIFSFIKGIICIFNNCLLIQREKSSDKATYTTSQKPFLSYLKLVVYNIKIGFMFLASMELSFISKYILRKNHDLIINSLSYFIWILRILSLVQMDLE